MSYFKKDYILWEIEYEDGIYYFADVKNADSVLQVIQISEAVYMELLRSERIRRNCHRWSERRAEQSELTEVTLNDRIRMKPKSVESIVIEKLRAECLWKLINKLPEKQKRRLVLYHFYCFTYKKIAEFEFRNGKVQKKCSEQAIKQSIDIAKKYIKKNFKE